MDVGTLVTSLVESEPKGLNGLASRVGVSAATISRWMAGRSSPRPAQEGRLRSLALRRQITVGNLSEKQGSINFSPISSEVRVRVALGAILREVREILHRGGHLSSRHEALDELTKLLFAHVVSIDNGGEGIGPHILSNGRSATTTLREFVAQTFRAYLPQSPSFELNPSDFELKLRPSEDKLCLELIDCFGAKASKSDLLQAQGAGQLDILNDVFGQFLADSFVDEKELGQYLTPTEVVRAMVALGLASLSESEIESLCSLDGAQDAGLILDPSCGVGSFLAETLRALYARAKSRLSPEDLSLWTAEALRHNIMGIDKSERMIRFAMTNLALFGAPAANLHLANSLLRSGSDGELCKSLAGRASLILTNPPFGAEFSGLDLEGYRIAGNWAARNPRTLDSEILFMERYLDWLAPGGVLVAIVPDNILTNRGVFSDLRNAVSSSVELLSVVSLPTVTFAAAGTSTKTSILHLRKMNSRPRRKTFFAICSDIGYEVITRGAYRQKVATGEGQLPRILDEVIRGELPEFGRWVRLDAKASRWDATYHAGLPEAVQRRLDEMGSKDIVVSRVASLSRERADPRRFGEGKFRYVEISDVDAGACTVGYKWVLCQDAPTRARKVIRSGDVLVSTVRPERRTIGVVGEDLDGGICSTGFAVLRPKEITPYTLAKLLQSDFANTQILRNNVGIAYPAVDEDCLTEILLPVGAQHLDSFASAANKVGALRQKLRDAENRLSSRVNRAIDNWLEP